MFYDDNHRMMTITIDVLAEEDEYDYDPEEPEKHKRKQSNEFKFNNNDLSSFLVWPEYDFWTGFIQLQNETEDGRLGF